MSAVITALAAMTALYWARLAFLAVLLLLSGALAGLAFGRSKR